MNPKVLSLARTALFIGGCAISVHVNAGLFEKVGESLGLKPTANSLVSFGRIRAIQCKFEGLFIGGQGFNCIMRNHDMNPRQSRMECVSFDGAGRVVGGNNIIYPIYNVVFRRSEERIVRMYATEGASSFACSDTGDVLNPNLLTQQDINKLQQLNLVSSLNF